MSLTWQHPVPHSVKLLSQHPPAAMIRVLFRIHGKDKPSEAGLPHPYPFELAVHPGPGLNPVRGDVGYHQVEKCQTGQNETRQKDVILSLLSDAHLEFSGLCVWIGEADAVVINRSMINNRSITQYRLHRFK